ncbi:hypothetical protein DFH09DRAFT_849576, partial [Mycena vulgaris]
GEKLYIKLHPAWNRKRGAKRTACQCVLLVKQYPGTDIVLGSYSDKHDHPLGNANLPYTQIPKDTKEYIAGLLRLKVSPDHIVSNTYLLHTTLILLLQLKLRHHGVYDSDNLFDSEASTAARTEFIELRDIRRIEKQIEAEAVRQHPDDGHLLGFKSKTDPVPPGSNLPPDVFLLMIQTDWQRRMFAKYGADLLCIDATHNVT